jgi:hypothetical protein
MEDQVAKFFMKFNRKKRVFARFLLLLTLVRFSRAYSGLRKYVHPQ